MTLTNNYTMLSVRVLSHDFAASTYTPNGKDAIDDELGRRICDANAVHDLVEVVRDQTRTRPL